MAARVTSDLLFNTANVIQSGNVSKWTDNITLTTAKNTTKLIFTQSNLYLKHDNK